MASNLAGIDWRPALDAVVAELLDAAGVSAPPVEPLQLARHLDLVVAYDADQASRARYKRCGPRGAIFLKPDVRAERLHWALAHELGEWHAWRVCQQAGLSESDLGQGDREELANQFASRLLLPHQWFTEDYRETAGDLFALKQRYPTASHEAIAWRMLEGGRPTVVTVYDQGRLSRRRSNLSHRCPPWQELERAVWQNAHQGGHRAEQTRQAVQVSAWPIHEPGWKREVIRMTWDLDAE